MAYTELEEYTKWLNEHCKTVQPVKYDPFKTAMEYESYKTRIELEKYKKLNEMREASIAARTDAFKEELRSLGCPEESIKTLVEKHPFYF